MNSTRYSNSATVTLDANGNGSVSINGPKPGQILNIQKIAVMVPNTQRIPGFQLFKNTLAIPANFLGSSSTGQQDTDATISLDLYPGEFLSGQWVHADPGLQATMVVEGTLYF